MRSAIGALTAASRRRACDRLIAERHRARIDDAGRLTSPRPSLVRQLMFIDRFRDELRAADELLSRPREASA